ncbi:MAG: hypothetical protein BMS9Abin33_1030 [Gammaproteobacteria bacterium]|nr:MAG: hypothetical protein BMS9Abin33_1030 [Gammaproteobacteria bacterium]
MSVTLRHSGLFWSALYWQAVATNCASEQDKYWAMQGRLFAFQNQLSAKFIYKLVSKINIAIHYARFLP